MMTHANVLGAIDDARSAEQLDTLTRSVWHDHALGRIGDDEAQRLAELLHTRRNAMASPRAAVAQLGQLRSIFPARRLQRASERSVAIERRRRLAASGPMPPQLAARFTTGQLAVLRVVADEVASQGKCELCLDALAARAGVSKRLAQTAVRLAEADGLLLVIERRQHGDRNLPNVLKVLSREWGAWIARGGRGGGCRTLRPTDTSSQNLGKSELVKSRQRAAEGQGRAREVPDRDSREVPAIEGRAMR